MIQNRNVMTKEIYMEHAYAHSKAIAPAVGYFLNLVIVLTGVSCFVNVVFWNRWEYILINEGLWFFVIVYALIKIQAYRGRQIGYQQYLRQHGGKMPEVVISVSDKISIEAEYLVDIQEWEFTKSFYPDDKTPIRHYLYQRRLF